MNSNQNTEMTDGSDNDELSLSDLIDALRDNTRLIAAVLMATVLSAGLYTQIATPIYESNLLLQVEDGGGSSLNKALFGDLSPALAGVKNPTQAEIEILRSRMVVSQPVEALNLYVHAQPVYFPVIGRAIARHAVELSEPGLFGFGGYAWGTEKLDVQIFNVPAAFYGQTWRVTAQANNTYTLLAPNGQSWSAVVGQKVRLPLASGEVELQIRHLAAKPGAKFVLIAHSKLATVEALQNQLSITEKGKSSGVLNVSLRGADPERVTTILNTIGQSYVAQNLRRKSEEAEKTLAFLEEQLPAIKKELETIENRFNKFRQQNNTLNLSEEAKALLEQTMKLAGSQVELKQKKIELSARFGPSHPSMIAADAVLQENQRQIDRLTSQAKSLPSTEQEVVRLSRETRVSTDLYTALLQSAQQMRLVKIGKVGNVRLIDSAVFPEKPVQPQKARIMAMSLLAGLVLGVGIALLRRFLRNSIDSPDAVERLTGQAVLASILHSPEQAMVSSPATRPPRLLVDAYPHSPTVEGLRSFMTALQFTLGVSPHQMLMVSGPTPGVGKSFLSANLAALMARNGKRVLLVDGDLRLGRLHDYFGLPSQNGLSELLIDQIDLAVAVHSHVVPGLDFIAAGTTPHNPAELLQRVQLPALLQALRERYDLVIMDAPPILPVADAAIMATAADAVIMVVREGVSNPHDITESVKRLNHVGVRAAGMVFNGMQIRQNSYGYAYGYAAEPIKKGALSAWTARLRAFFNS